MFKKTKTENAEAGAPPEGREKKRSHTSPPQGVSLFDRIGGKNTVDAIVEIVLLKILADSRILHFFQDVDINRLRTRLKEFLTVAFGGSLNQGKLIGFLKSAFGGTTKYDAKMLGEAHAPLLAKGLSDRHFDAMMDNFCKTLVELQLPNILINEVVTVVAATRGAVLSNNHKAKVAPLVQAPKGGKDRETGKPPVEKKTPVVEDYAIEIIDEKKNQPQPNAALAEESLFDKIGGHEVLGAAVDLFLKKVLADSCLVSFFHNTNMNRLRAKQKAFLTMVFGGPSKYNEYALGGIHAPMLTNGLSDLHFDAIKENLKNAFKEVKIPDNLIQEALKIVESKRALILGKDNSSPIEEVMVAFEEVLVEVIDENVHHPKPKGSPRDARLFEEIGGKKTVDAAVENLCLKILADPRIRNMFQTEEVNQLRDQQRAFLTMVFGGLSQQDERELTGAFARLVEKGLEGPQFDAMLDNLHKTLADLKIPDELMLEAEKIAESMRFVVLGKVIHPVEFAGETKEDSTSPANPNEEMLELEKEILKLQNEKRDFEDEKSKLESENNRLKSEKQVLEGERSRLESEKHELENEVARVFTMIESVPANVMFCGLDLKIQYLNPASCQTLKTIETFLPVPAEKMSGQPLDILHEDLENQHDFLSDPKNLPHTMRLQLGPETLDLRINPVFNKDKRHKGLIVTWEVVTERLKAEEREKAVRENMREILEEVTANANTLASASSHLAASNQEPGGSAGETSMGIVSKNRVDQNHFLNDPKNLPHRSQFQVGPDIMELVINPVYDREQNYVGPMVTWEVITGRQKAEQREKVAMKNMQHVLGQVAGNADALTSASHQLLSISEKMAGNTEETSARAKEVIKVVTSIATQTRLLAMNVSIDAARGGGSGKGATFAMEDVQELATQTVRATEDINQRIQDIQSKTWEWVDAAIGEITRMSDQINDIAHSITHSQEQVMTPEKIAQSVHDVSIDGSEDTDPMADAGQPAQNTSRGAEKAEKAANEFSNVAEQLQALVHRFQGLGFETEDTNSTND